MQISSSLIPHWSSLMIHGAIAIVFGLCGWFAPEASLAILMFIFAAYFFVDGAIRTWLAIASKNENPLWWMLLVGGLILEVIPELHLSHLSSKMGQKIFTLRREILFIE